MFWCNVKVHTYLHVHSVICNTGYTFNTNGKTEKTMNKRAGIVEHKSLASPAKTINLLI